MAVNANGWDSEILPSPGMSEAVTVKVRADRDSEAHARGTPLFVRLSPVTTTDDAGGGATKPVSVKLRLPIAGSVAGIAPVTLKGYRANSGESSIRQPVERTPVPASVAEKETSASGPR
jgi:hypothetical protein